jgi:hypothetical protein
MFCPHCKTEIKYIDIRSGTCPDCGKQVKIFQLDEAIEKYIHLFELIAIISAIALLLPQLTIGLEDLDLVTITPTLIVPLYFALVMCCFLIVFFLIFLISRISNLRLISPVRKFWPSAENPKIIIRRGDSQLFLFFGCFFLLYAAIFTYILLTLPFSAIIITAIFCVLWAIQWIHDYLSQDKTEREHEIEY